VDLDKSISMDAKQPIALFNRGVLLAAKGEKEKARADFEAVLKLTPDSKPAKEQLAALNKSGK
jgi:TolA-binding protein